jgi:hypothetical protein
VGHDSRPYRRNTAIEEQRVVCRKAHDNSSTGFFLELFGSVTAPIYADSTLTEIKYAVEFHPFIDNVTVSLPNADTDGIHTACHSNVDDEQGGFLLRFRSNSGNIPLLRALEIEQDSRTFTGFRRTKVRGGRDPFAFTGTLSFPTSDDVSVFPYTEGYSVRYSIG